LNSIEILILAGGKATRFPNKLRHPVGSVSMLAQVCGTFSSSYRTYISCSVRDHEPMRAQFDCPLVVDHWPGSGPLGGMLTAMEVMQSPLVFAIAGDMPFVDVSLVHLLYSQYAGEEAVVPLHDDDGVARTSPLAALYDPPHFCAKGMPCLRGGKQRSIPSSIAYGCASYRCRTAPCCGASIRPPTTNAIVTRR